MKKHGKTVLFGIYAGMAIGFGGLLNIVANTLLSSVPIWGRILGSFLFPIGLTMVCFFSFNLFTGKIGYLFDNDKSYLLFLLFVYIGNILINLLKNIYQLMVGSYVINNKKIVLMLIYLRVFV